MAKVKHGEGNGATAEVTAAPEAQAPAAPAEKHSPKHKASRGVPEDWVTTWVPFDAPAGQNETLRKAAAQRDVKVGAMLAEVLKAAIESKRSELEEDAAKWDAREGAGKTPEQLQSELARLQAKMQALQAKLGAAAK